LSVPERRGAAGWQLHGNIAAGGNDSTLSARSGASGRPLCTSWNDNNEDSIMSARYAATGWPLRAAAAEENTDAAAEDSVAAATSDNSYAEVPLRAKQAKVVSTVIRCLIASETRVPGPERIRVACKPIILSIEDGQRLCDFCSAP
jgi:hypothetical protein